MCSKLALIVLILAPFPAPVAATPGTNPLLVNTTGKTLVRKLFVGNDQSIAIVSSKGTSVFLNPRYTKVVPDVAGFTHTRAVDGAFVHAAKAASVLVATPGVVAVKDVKLTAIPASHDDVPVATPPDYVLLLVEVDGLRMAYFVGTHQRKFTPEQLAALGKVDVAMIGVGLGSLGVPRASETYAMARSLSPKVILTLTPHFSDYEMALEDIADAGGKVETLKDPLLLDQTGLKDAPQRVIDLVATNSADLSYSPAEGGAITVPDIDLR